MTEQTHERTLSPFEKNRFFEGKLMTPRDMTVEQQYHADRLHTLARFVLGSGVVRGLGVVSVTESDEELAVTVEPGVAIDGYGRPIQVDRRTTTTLPPPEADRISLYVRHSEQPAESAPVPKEVGDTADGNAVNRAIESFEVTYRAGPPPEGDESAGLDLDGIDSTDPTSMAREIAGRYHERHRTDLSVPEDPAVFVGSCERSADGNWTDAGGSIRRHAVDQGLLFTTLVEHLADDHQGGSTGNGADSGQERTAERLDRLETTVAAVERDRDALARYAVRRTLRDRTRQFEEVADRIEPASDAASRLAREIAATDRDRRDALVEDEQALYRSLDTLGAPLEDLADRLEGICTAQSVERYRESVTALETALDDGPSLLTVIEAHDRVCERAGSLSRLLDVVPE